MSQEKGDNFPKETGPTKIDRRNALLRLAILSLTGYNFWNIFFNKPKDDSTKEVLNIEKEEIKELEYLVFRFVEYAFGQGYLVQKRDDGYEGNLINDEQELLNVIEDYIQKLNSSNLIEGGIDQDLKQSLINLLKRGSYNGKDFIKELSEENKQKVKELFNKVLLSLDFQVKINDFLEIIKNDYKKKIDGLLTEDDLEKLKLIKNYLEVFRTQDLEQTQVLLNSFSQIPVDDLENMKNYIFYQELSSLSLDEEQFGYYYDIFYKNESLQQELLEDLKHIKKYELQLFNLLNRAFKDNDRSFDSISEHEVYDFFHSRILNIFNEGKILAEQNIENEEEVYQIMYACLLRLANFKENSGFDSDLYKKFLEGELNDFVGISQISLKETNNEKDIIVNNNMYDFFILLKHFFPEDFLKIEKKLSLFAENPDNFTTNKYFPNKILINSFYEFSPNLLKEGKKEFSVEDILKLDKSFFYLIFKEEFGEFVCLDQVSRDGVAIKDLGLIFSSNGGNFVCYPNSKRRKSSNLGKSYFVDLRDLASLFCKKNKPKEPISY